MSEFTNTKDLRLQKLLKLSEQLLKTGNAMPFITENKDFISSVIPTDFIALFDELIKKKHPIDEIKILSNKILNIFHKTIKDYPRIEPEKDSFLWVLEQNNKKMNTVLNTVKTTFKELVKEPENKQLKSQLLSEFQTLSKYVNHYTIKENILFPIIEKTWPDHRCLQIMWSFHDDIKRNIKTVIEQLETKVTDLIFFNKCVANITFNMYAIKFREERILYPYILSTISEKELEKMNREGFNLGYPYFQPILPTFNDTDNGTENSLINLGTGAVSVEQIKLIFNHLPVDITFVDENNKVCYFSTPPKRIFPRTTAIIGREVSNCHPPESVHVVEQIVESFRNGQKDHADFWITMKGEFILIQYFAVRDGNGNYKGVIEVSQEVSGIKALEGEKRLLDW